jgi:hypothetical protein
MVASLSPPPAEYQALSLDYLAAVEAKSLSKRLGSFKTTDPEKGAIHGIECERFFYGGTVPVNGSPAVVHGGLYVFKCDACFIVVSGQDADPYSAKSLETFDQAFATFHKIGDSK